MLKLHSRWQHNVGELSRVGHKVFDHDCEEIRAGQCLSTPGLMRIASDRIAPVNEERFDRRVIHLKQYLAEPCHAEAPCVAWSQVLAVERRPVPAEETACVVTNAPSGIAPVAGDAR